MITKSDLKDWTLEGRADGSFIPYLRLTYSDSNPMITVGGYFGGAEVAASVSSAIADEFCFLRSAELDFVYDVGDFNLTDPERRLFNRAALAPFGPCRDGAQLRNLGFGDADIMTYRDLMRYVPRYFETLL